MKIISECYSVLSDIQIEKIHDRSLYILEKIGVTIGSDKARALFVANGCTMKGDRIYIKRQVMEEICRYKQADMKMVSRNGNSITFKRGRTHYHNSGTVAQIFNSVSGEMRTATQKDVIDMTRLLDTMDQVDMVTPIVYPQDVDQKVSLLYAIKETLKHTTKPVSGPGVNNLKEAKIISEMFDVLATSEHRPTLCMSCSPVSPLNIPEGDADSLIYLVEKGFPVEALPCPIVGMTAPMSLLGAITQNNAEVLAILALARLIDPEAIVSYGGRLVVANMSAMNTLGGVPEDTIVDICAVQMAHYYHLVSNIYGTGTCGFTPDVQVGFEK